MAAAVAQAHARPSRAASPAPRATKGQTISAASKENEPLTANRGSAQVLRAEKPRCLTAAPPTPAAVVPLAPACTPVVAAPDPRERTCAALPWSAALLVLAAALLAALKKPQWQAALVWFQAQAAASLSTATVISTLETVLTIAATVVVTAAVTAMAGLAAAASAAERAGIARVATAVSEVASRAAAEVLAAAAAAAASVPPGWAEAAAKASGEATLAARAVLDATGGAPVAAGCAMTAVLAAFAVLGARACCRRARSA